MKQITATIATPKPNAVAIKAEPIPIATAADWLPCVAKSWNVYRILTTVPNKPKNGATPPIVPRIVKWFSNFLDAKLAAISNERENPFFCSEKILTASSVTSPITPHH